MTTLLINVFGFEEKDHAFKFWAEVENTEMKESNIYLHLVERIIFIAAKYIHSQNEWSKRTAIIGFRNPENPGLNYRISLRVTWRLIKWWLIVWIMNLLLLFFVCPHKLYHVSWASAKMSAVWGNGRSDSWTFRNIEGHPQLNSSGMLCTQTQSILSGWW